MNDLYTLDFELLRSNDITSLGKLKESVTKIGFLKLKNLPISKSIIETTFKEYKTFFSKSINEKNKVNMKFTNSNRGWGESKSEQVNSNYMPDLKEMYDSGPVLNFSHKFKNLPYYAKNIWPNDMPELRKISENFYSNCSEIGLLILKKIAKSLNYSENYFSDKFDLPMALLRCNYYHAKPFLTQKNEFGIAPHTDYGCLTLLFTQSDNGLEIKQPNGKWLKVQAKKDEIIVNFGDMLELWSNKKIKATLHKVNGTKNSRYSIPFFFNPRHDTLIGKDKNNRDIFAGDYLAYKYDTTYRHKMN
ncbi:MAG: hypothetical protein CMN44_07395 [SAR116 cluster bacterium]|nr:hypothetical protein [SAR116 cluster bacterium]RPH09130.1 MAG: isopenicillin N synthase family oxygenase [Alphaproteobacteria bacterium TMED54]